ncbi:MAG: NAD(P)H-quinone oxidoreductase [Acidobacteriaceae bacterium]|nr:NAD(P)H-quinone oxidoreductase [Acidobacteriaceae bacterium]
MLAIAVTRFGPPEVLQPVTLPDPKPGPSEVLIRMQAAGVARADVLQRKGHYPPPPGASDIPGLDVAGVIEEVGEGVSSWQLGDRVCAILSGGGYAELCVAPARQVLPVPEGWTLAEAATLPENGFTVYDNLLTRARLRRGETVLVHGGTSGIGTIAIMFARAWGARVLATAGSEEKRQACLRFGADDVINYKTQDFAEEVRRLTDNRGVDVILDMVGGSYLERNLDSLALDGRLTIIATQGGAKGELNIGRLMQKRASVMGSTMRARTAAEKSVVARGLLQDIWPLLPPKKVIRPVIDSIFPLREAARAHERMESGQHIGRIVLTSERSLPTE